MDSDLRECLGLSNQTFIFVKFMQFLFKLSEVPTPVCLLWFCCSMRQTISRYNKGLDSSESALVENSSEAALVENKPEVLHLHLFSSRTWLSLFLIYPFVQWYALSAIWF